LAVLRNYLSSAIHKLGTKKPHRRDPNRRAERLGV